MIEKTCALIKPDAVAANNVGNIISMIEQDGFDIIAMKKIHLTDDQAREFYRVHQDASWFNELIEFMTSGPIIAMVLEKDQAIIGWRELMGATDPSNAAAGTIRQKYGADVGKNAVHGSDAHDTAQVEIGFFFPDVTV